MEERVHQVLHPLPSLRVEVHDGWGRFSTSLSYFPFPSMGVVRRPFSRIGFLWCGRSASVPMFRWERIVLSRVVDFVGVREELSVQVAVLGRLVLY